MIRVFGLSRAAMGYIHNLVDVMNKIKLQEYIYENVRVLS